MPATTEPIVAPPRLSLARRVHPLTGDIGMSTALADTHHVDLALEIPMRIGVILECYKSLGTII
jgi:hypothetical protein